MKSEEEKYLKALHEAQELKKTFDEMRPETKARFVNDFIQLAGIQHLLSEFQKYMSSK